MTDLQYRFVIESFDNILSSLWNESLTSAEIENLASLSISEQPISDNENSKQAIYISSRINTLNSTVKRLHELLEYRAEQLKFRFFEHLAFSGALPNQLLALSPLKHEISTPVTNFKDTVGDIQEPDFGKQNSLSNENYNSNNIESHDSYNDSSTQYTSTKHIGDEGVSSPSVTPSISRYSSRIPLLKVRRRQSLPSLETTPRTGIRYYSETAKPMILEKEEEEEEEDIETLIDGAYSQTKQYSRRHLSFSKLKPLELNLPKQYSSSPLNIDRTPGYLAPTISSILSSKASPLVISNEQPGYEPRASSTLGSYYQQQFYDTLQEHLNKPDFQYPGVSAEEMRSTSSLLPKRPSLLSSKQTPNSQARYFGRGVSHRSSMYNLRQSEEVQQDCPSPLLYRNLSQHDQVMESPLARRKASCPHLRRKFDHGQ